jgi:hypothetical protein
MREHGRFPTTILALRRRPCRPRHPFAAPRTSLQCVCTRRRNCIEQLSPSPKYAPGSARFPVRNSAIIKLGRTAFADDSRRLTAPATTKSPGTMPGASMLVAGSARSVPRHGRAAELVVQAGGDEIDVLTDAVGAEGGAARRGEVVGTVLHEQVIVLDAN